MGQVLQFPDSRAQGLTFLDRELRKLLIQKGADEALIDFAANQLTTIYAELSEATPEQYAVELPPGLTPEQCEALDQAVGTALAQVHQDQHSLLVRLMARLVLTELRLFQYERTDG